MYIEMGNPFFSIIVPVYNTELYLSQCIDSILSQSFIEFELILVDDGSCDSSGSICDSYKLTDTRIRVFHKDNGGVVSARQLGLENAIGKYVAFIDSDDWVSYEYLQKFYEQICNGSYDVVICGYKAVVDGQQTLFYPDFCGICDRNRKKDILFPKLIQDAYCGHCVQSLCAKVFKRELVYREHSLIDSTIGVGEDGACTIPCLYFAKAIYGIDDCLYYYRRTSNSVTGSQQAFSWDGPEKIAKHLMSRIPMEEFDFRQQLYRKTVHELFTVLRSHFMAGASLVSVKMEYIEAIKSPLYCKCITKAKFEGFYSNLMHFSLKHRILFPTLVYSKVRKF